MKVENQVPSILKMCFARKQWKKTKGQKTSWHEKLLLVPTITLGLLHK